jgi:hypothetical protein
MHDLALEPRSIDGIPTVKSLKHMLNSMDLGSSNERDLV